MSKFKISTQFSGYGSPELKICSFLKVVSATGHFKTVCKKCKHYETSKIENHLIEFEFKVGIFQSNFLI